MTRQGFRRFLVGATVGFGGLAAACDRIAESSTGSSVLNAAESLTYRAQQMLLGANRLAREFSDSDITPDFKSNGTGNPSDKEYQLLAGGNFADWRLRVDGLVDKALDFPSPIFAPFPHARRSPDMIAWRA